MRIFDSIRKTEYSTVVALGFMVGVALETVKQIESQMTMRHYKGFLD